MTRAHRLALAGLFFVTAACGASGPTIPVHHKGPHAGVNCPSGTVLYGNAPPKGKILFCADPNKQGLAARSGPVVDWACDRCKDGKSLHGEYVLGKKDGAWTLVTREGAKLDTCSWKNGKRAGDWVGFYPNGQPHFHRKYDEEGHRDGIEWSNYDNGQREYERGWSEGLRDGLWKTWNRKGIPTSEGEYDRDKQYGAWKSFDKAGKVIKLSYYEKGKVVREGHMENGQLLISSLGPDGKKTGTWSERDGRKHGVVVKYHAGTEVPFKKTTYVDGEQTGLFTLHRKDGTKYVGGMLVKGKRQCGWRLYDKGGRETTRLPQLAAVLLPRAKADAKANNDPCQWTVQTALELRHGADAPMTIAIARWIMEHEATGPETDVPPPGPPGLDVRLAAMGRLAEQADAAAKKFAFEKAALLYIAVLLEADRALGGKLLNLPPTATLPGSPTWPGPMPDATKAKGFKNAAKALVPGIDKLLHEKERGDKAVRKAGRVTLGKVGISKLTLRKFKKSLK